MPIKKHLRKFYGRHWRKVIRPKILKRAGGKFDDDGRYLGGACCEQCGAEDLKYIVRHPDWPGVWFEYPSGIARHRYSKQRRRITHLPSDLLSQKQTLVQIGVAHVNNIAGDDRNKNLRAWCRDCHLHHDERHHKLSRATRKDDLRPILRLVNGLIDEYLPDARKEIKLDELREPDWSAAGAGRKAAIV